MKYIKIEHNKNEVSKCDCECKDKNSKNQTKNNDNSNNNSNEKKSEWKRPKRSILRCKIYDINVMTSNRYEILCEKKCDKNENNNNVKQNTINNARIIKLIKRVNKEKFAINPVENTTPIIVHN